MTVWLLFSQSCAIVVLLVMNILTAIICSRETQVVDRQLGMNQLPRGHLKPNNITKKKFIIVYLQYPHSLVGSDCFFIFMIFKCQVKLKSNDEAGCKYKFKLKFGSDGRSRVPNFPMDCRLHPSRVVLYNFPQINYSFLCILHFVGPFSSLYFNM